MSGINGTYYKTAKTSIEDSKRGLTGNEYRDSNLNVEANWIDKFRAEKVLFENEKYLIVTDGVFFNLNKLNKQYNAKGLGDLCILMFELEGETFVRHLRGSFVILFWDKRVKKLLIYTDHIGTKPIFYSNTKDVVLFSHDLESVLDGLKTQNIEYSLNETAAWQMLSFGFLLEDNSYINEVKKLTAGHYLVVTDKEVSVKMYHQFSYLPDHTMDDNYIIDMADKLFMQAVKRQTDKNEEYGYENYAPMSAGMDTRILNYCVRKIIKKPIFNFTYSQSGFYDQSMAQTIALELGNHWIFKSLDYGYSLMKIDKSVAINQGLMAYYGIAVVDDIFSTLDSDKMGLILTGLRGSGTISTKNKGELSTENLFADAFSQQAQLPMMHRIDLPALHQKYKYLEMFTLYNCGFGGINMGSPMVFAQKTESYSPFLDVDFLEFCLTIPFEKRYDNRIFDAWMLTKYPDAAKYLHNGNRYIGGEKIHKSKPTLKVGKRYYSVKEIPKLAALTLLRKLGWSSPVIGDRGIDSPHNVAPIGYWYNTNEVLKKHLDEYYERNIERLANYSELIVSCRRFYLAGGGMEKNQVLTLLAVMKKYF